MEECRKGKAFEKVDLKKEIVNLNYCGNFEQMPLSVINTVQVGLGWLMFPEEDLKEGGGWVDAGAMYIRFIMEDGGVKLFKISGYANMTFVPA